MACRRRSRPCRRRTDVADLLTAAAAEDPDRLALVEAGGRSVTWAELDDEVGRVATGLGAAGIVAGHRVMLVLGNRIEFVTTYLGVLRAQAVAVPVNPPRHRRAGPDDRRLRRPAGRRRRRHRDRGPACRRRRSRRRWPRAPRRLDRGRPAGPRCDPAGRRRRRHAAARRARPTTTCAPTAPRAVPPLLDPEKLAALLYTSGTSGRPRAAMLTHRALLANIEQVAAVEPPMIHGDDVVLGVLPLFHVYGLNAVLGGVLRHRAKLVLAERFDPQGTLDLIEDEACSVVPSPRRSSPTGATSSDLARAARPGAAGALRAPRRSRPSSSTELHRAHRHPGAPGLRPDRGLAGRDQHPVQRRRSSPARSAPRCPASSSGWSTRPAVRPRASDPGEIQVRGDNLFSGYWPDGADGPDARRLVVHRRRRLPRRRPATCSWSTGSRSWSSSPASTSTRSRSRTSSARSPASRTPP